MLMHDIPSVTQSLQALANPEIYALRGRQALLELDAVVSRTPMDWTIKNDLSAAFGSPEIIRDFSAEQCLIVLISLLRKSRYVEGLIDDARTIGLLEELSQRWLLLAKSGQIAEVVTAMSQQE